MEPWQTAILWDPFHGLCGSGNPISRYFSLDTNQGPYSSLHHSEFNFPRTWSCRPRRWQGKKNRVLQMVFFVILADDFLRRRHSFCGGLDVLDCDMSLQPNITRRIILGGERLRTF